jgi:hypothetical protein
VDILTDGHEVIARLDSLTEKADEETLDGVAAEPEVIEKGKKEEEDF